MNWRSPEIEEELQLINEKLDEGLNYKVTVGDIVTAIDLPILSEFSQLAQSLLPVNLISIDRETGRISLLSLTELQQGIQQSLINIKDYFEQEAIGLYNSAVGEVNTLVNEFRAVYNQIISLGRQIQQDNSLITDLVLSTVNGALGLSLNAQTLGFIREAATTTLNNFAALSPKQLRDLADPDFYGRLIVATLDAMLAATEATALVLGEEATGTPLLDRSSYSNLFESNFDPEYRIAVERTVYWGKGEGATAENAAKKSSSGAQLKNDYSLAVDNSNVLLGSKVKFSDDGKTREAVDVAIAAKGITTSGSYPVVAIYFDEKEKALEYQRQYPKFTTAIVDVPNNTGRNQNPALQRRITELNERIKQLEKQGKAKIT